jgi:hypothetical protein
MPGRFPVTSLTMPNPPNWKRVMRTKPDRWGTPFPVGAPGVPDRATAVARFRQHLAERPELVELGPGHCPRLRG